MVDSNRRLDQDTHLNHHVGFGWGNFGVVIAYKCNEKNVVLKYFLLLYMQLHNFRLQIRFVYVTTLFGLIYKRTLQLFSSHIRSTPICQYNDVIV